jgi:hypothetical protein
MGFFLEKSFPNLAGCFCAVTYGCVNLMAGMQRLNGATPMAVNQCAFFHQKSSSHYAHWTQVLIVSHLIILSE